MFFLGGWNALRHSGRGNTGPTLRPSQRLAVPVAAGLALLGFSVSGATAGAETVNSAAGGLSATTAATADPATGGGTDMRRVDFVLPDLDGHNRRLSEWDGQVILLNFWATWCPPCKKEMPMFQQRYESHAAHGFTIVAVAVDELDDTRAFVTEHGIEFPVLIGQADAIAVGRQYGNRIGALPYTLIIDREGFVRETHRGEVTAADVDNWLRRHL